ncbi:MAG TPA: endolytic transglycosylase MltG [Bacillales bacterium]|nr:endolytic transglycosylase MltG [Bacillales bacterium]
MPVVNREQHFEKIEERAKEAKLVRRIVFYVILGLAVILAAAAGGGYYYVQNALEPVNPDNDKKVEVKIQRGSSSSEIAKALEKNNIINSSLVFRYYVKYKNVGGFQAGIHTFSPSMEIDEIIEQLQKTGRAITNVVFKMTIPEGLRMTDVADTIAEKTDLKKKEILEKMQDRKYIKSTFMKDYPFLTKAILEDKIRYPLEGYLFPATYSFTEENPSLEAVIDKMLDKTGEVLQDFQADIAKSKMSVHEIMTLASVIEEEAKKEEGRRIVSSVFHNRLKKGMKLQSNPTVDYAVKKHRVKMSTKDTKVDSPYNTYVHKGLPVGPISNPGKGSISAAVNPKQTDYLYFYARPSGEIMAAKDYEKFLEIKHKYEDEWEAYLKKKNEKQ